jgi:dynein heavy chain
MHANADITRDINDSNALFTALLSMGAAEAPKNQKGKGKGSKGKKQKGGANNAGADSGNDKNDGDDDNDDNDDDDDNDNGGGDGGGGGGAADGGEAAAAADDDEYADEPRVVGIAARLLAQLPNEFDVDAVQRKYPVLYEQSMNTVLCQELIRYNRLVRAIRRTLEQSIKAVRGQIVMSQDLDDVAGALMTARVPAAWLFHSYPTRKSLGPYVSDLLERLRFFDDWIASGQPVVFWISGFFFTHSFLTAALQNAARKYTLPIDTLGLDFEFRNTEEELNGKRPVDGVYIKGIWLEGARWDPDRMMLAECRPKELFAPAPIVWLKPTERAKFAKFQHYMCPVYKTLERHGVLKTTGHSSNYLDSFKFPTDRPPSHWTLRGVAGVLSIEQ